MFQGLRGKGRHLEGRGGLTTDEATPFQVEQHSERHDQREQGPPRAGQNFEEQGKIDGKEIGQDRDGGDPGNRAEAVEQ